MGLKGLHGDSLAPAVLGWGWGVGGGTIELAGWLRLGVGILQVRFGGAQELITVVAKRVGDIEALGVLERGGLRVREGDAVALEEVVELSGVHLFFYVYVSIRARVGAVN